MSAFNFTPRREKPRYDYLIVGAGFAGSVLAERLASQHKARVLLIDRRNHIGGNAYDEKDSAGILYHKYGPHIFHTNSGQVVDYLSQFTEWRPYEHRVLADVRGQARARRAVAVANSRSSRLRSRASATSSGWWISPRPVMAWLLRVWPGSRAAEEDV